MQSDNYIPAAGFGFLTRLYDPLVRITCRETYFKKRLIETAEIKPGQHLLDVGCGTGTLLMQIHQFKASVYLHGLDGDADILKLAHEKVRNTDANINWLHAYSTNIPVEDASMDIVTNSLMIHHLMPDQKMETFREMYRVLKPGGRMVLVDWGKPSNMLFRSLFKFIRILDGHPNTLNHLNGEIPEMIKNADFRDVQIIEKINTTFGTLDLITATKTS
jgi:2-polyprenyl-3-methyl-5-hydroxy-6-metoxy-1,4-benzoquinol methylase